MSGLRTPRSVVASVLVFPRTFEYVVGSSFPKAQDTELERVEAFPWHSGGEDLCFWPPPFLVAHYMLLPWELGP